MSGSPKQKANRERFKRLGPKINQRELKEMNKPKESWWVGLDRQALDNAAAANLARMRNSLLGRISVAKTID